MSDPVPILYVAWAPFFSGAERALLVLLQHLDRRRYRPFVVVGTEGELAARARDLAIEVRHVPIRYTSLAAVAAWGLSVARFTGALRRTRAALVHANDVPSFQPAGFAARLLQAPAVTHVRFPDSPEGFRWFLKPGFRRALFVSEALRAPAASASPALFGDRSEVVYDGVVRPEPLTPDGRRQIRRELGLPEHDCLVLLNGQIAEVKGIWDFVDAARRLVEARVPVSFAVLGDDLRGEGALRRRAEGTVAELGLSDRVHFLGFRPDAPRLVPAFDIAAVPSHVEPLGNATLEAMAAGLPVVGSRVDGIPEMVVDGVTGLLVPSRSPDRLADAIRVLVDDPARARRFGCAGRERAAAAFSVERHVDQVMEIYDRVIRDHKR